jgi:excinuclease ABC subunit B
MYADKITGSMERAISEVDRRRKIQEDYNKKHKLSPTQIEKPIRDRLIDEIVQERAESKKLSFELDDADFSKLPPTEVKKEIKRLSELMKYEAEMLNFEKASVLRDKVRAIKKYLD